MLEIVPAGTSEGKGVRMLLDHLGISQKEVTAIGEGENDVEMLELAASDVTLRNGSDKTKLAADIIGASNDEDGAAEAIHQAIQPILECSCFLFYSTCWIVWKERNQRTNSKQIDHILLDASSLK